MLTPSEREEQSKAGSKENQKSKGKRQMAKVRRAQGTLHGWRHFCFLPFAFCLLIFLWTCPLWGQAPPEPVKLGSVVVSGSIRSRVESWEWFTPNSGDPSYTFMGNHMRLNFTRPGKKLDWT